MSAKKHLETAFELISTVPVSGANVEVMARAKAELRAAYTALTEAEKVIEKPETEEV